MKSFTEMSKISNTEAKLVVLEAKAFETKAEGRNIVSIPSDWDSPELRAKLEEKGYTVDEQCRAGVFFRV